MTEWGRGTFLLDYQTDPAFMLFPPVWAEKALMEEDGISSHLIFTNKTPSIFLRGIGNQKPEHWSSEE